MGAGSPEVAQLDDAASNVQNPPSAIERTRIE
jgi:hypothetical protein